MPEGVSDSPVSETPETIEENSVQGREDKLSHADIAPVLNHLKKSCEAIATEMPRGHMSAYETIFRRIFDAFTNMDTTQASYMINFLMSIWQLLDIITPSHLRDTQFCVIETCCDGDVSTRLSIPGGLFDIVDTIAESIPENVTVGWRHEEKTFQFETRTSEMSEELVLETKWLKGSDGFASQSGRILEVGLVVSPFWLVRKMAPRLRRDQDD